MVQYRAGGDARRSVFLPFFCGALGFEVRHLHFRGDAGRLWTLAVVAASAGSCEACLEGDLIGNESVA